MTHARVGLDVQCKITSYPAVPVDHVVAVELRKPVIVYLPAIRTVASAPDSIRRSCPANGHRFSPLAPTKQPTGGHQISPLSELS